MMRHSNSVHLDGAVTWCRMTGEKDGVAVARLVMYTLHPKGPDLSGYKPSEKFDKVFHRVRWVAGGAEAQQLRDLDAESRKCGAVLDRLVPVSLDGRFAVVDGHPAVEVRGPGLRFTDRVPNEDNNNVSLSGTVKETTYTDKVAKVLLDIDGLPMQVQISRSSNPKGWEAVSSKAIGKGDELTLEGPTMSSRYTNGKETFFTCSVFARELNVPKLAKDEKRSRGGVTM